MRLQLDSSTGATLSLRRGILHGILTKVSSHLATKIFDSQSFAHFFHFFQDEAELTQNDVLITPLMGKFKLKELC